MNCTVVRFWGGNIYSKICTLFSLVGTKMYTYKFWKQCIWVFGIDPLTPQPPCTMSTLWNPQRLRNQNQNRKVEWRRFSFISPFLNHLSMEYSIHCLGTDPQPTLCDVFWGVLQDELWAYTNVEFLIVWIFMHQFKILNFPPNPEEKLNLPPDKFLFVEKAAIHFCFEGNTALRTG